MKSIARMRLKEFANACAQVRAAPDEQGWLGVLIAACYARQYPSCKDAMPPLAERRAAVRALRVRGIL